MSEIDNDKLGALVGKMLADPGGAFSVPAVRIGDGPFNMVLEDRP